MTQPAQRPPAGIFIWNELASRDIEAAKRFYSAVLGWEYDGMDMGPMGTYWLVRGGENGVAGLMQMPPDVPAEVPSNWLPYATTPDVDAAHAKVGAATVYPPMDVPNVGRMFAFRDPTGAVMALMTPEGGTDDRTPALPPPTHGHFMWNELVTSDMARAGNFLSDLVGWQMADMPGGPPGDYKLFQVHGVGVAGMMTLGKPHWGNVPSHWMGYIAVKDVAAAQNAVSKHGGKVIVPPIEVPGIGKFIVITDPTGAFVSLMQPAA